MNPFVREVLSEVRSFFLDEGAKYTTLDARDPRFWATMAIFAILLVPAAAAAEIITQVAT